MLNVRLIALNSCLRCGGVLGRAAAVGPSGTPVRFVRGLCPLPSAAPGSPTNARPSTPPHQRDCIGARRRSACEARAATFESMRRGAGSYFGRRPSKPSTLLFSGRQARSCLSGTLGGPPVRRREFCGRPENDRVGGKSGEAGPQRAAPKIGARPTPAQRLKTAFQFKKSYERNVRRPPSKS